jgi:hypothetical protein
MIEQLTIIPIRITKAGQQYSFQHKLPRSAEKIIGIETGVTMRSPLPVIRGNDLRQFKREVLLGSLHLQGTGSSNLFYAADIKADDNSIANGEFLKSPRSPKRPVFPFYDFRTCTHGSKREEDPLDIPGCSIIGGIYRDRAGLVFYNPVHYHINIYVWTSNRQS